MSRTELRDSRVLVIGGSSGIGFEVARTALGDGARVTIASSNAEKLRAATQRLGEVQSARLDIGDEAAIAAYFAASGQFDHIAVTAADPLQVGQGDFSGTGMAAAQALFRIRFWGVLAVAKHAAKRIAPGGSLTLTSGMAAHRPQKGLAMLTAMAGAVEHLVMGLAVELAPIRVNGICPGVIATETWDDIPPAFRAPLEDRLAGQLLPRPGNTAEIAQAYLYLMRGSYTTGQIIRVEGGWGLSG